jgi:hypothetical protein
MVMLCACAVALLFQRRREIPTTRETFEDKLFEDLMWSDPKA